MDIPQLGAQFATQFRNGVLTAMAFGEPTVDEDKPRFLFPQTKGYPPGTALDQEGQPLDPTIEPLEETGKDPVTIPCAVEFEQAKAEELPVGAFRPTKATITILDTHFQQIVDATDVVLGGDKYQIAYRPPPVGAGPVTVYQLVCYARQET